jgi:hypothetical protein
VPAGSFIEVVASFIRWTRFGASKDGPSAIGLTFGGGNVYGWVESDLGKTGVNHVSNIRRVDFGVTEDVLKSGMKQEVRVEFWALSRLGELLGEIPLEPQGGIYPAARVLDLFSNDDAGRGWHRAGVYR